MGVIVGYIVFFAICLGFIMGYGFKAIIDDSKKQKGGKE